MHVIILEPEDVYIEATNRKIEESKKEVLD